MESFDWRDSQNVQWQMRYPDRVSMDNDTAGIDRWRNANERIGAWESGEPYSWFSGDNLEESAAARLPRPRVFISHRSKDNGLATDVASEARAVGLHYWLDAEDAALLKLHKFPVDQRAIATASIIEVALLNCTHILAIISDRTRGSMWVPYEYSRMKEDSLRSQLCGALDARDNTCLPFPEYLHLGKVLDSVSAVKCWFQDIETNWPPPAIRRAYPGHVR